MRFLTSRTLVFLLLCGASLAQAIEIEFKQVTDGVFAYIGDTEGRTYENEGLNANIGLVVTPSGNLLIDSGASFQSAQKIAQAVAKINQKPIKWVINTGGQDHRWLGNGYFKSQGAEIIAHAGAEADMKSRSQNHLNVLKPILKERFDGTVPTLPTRWLQLADNKLDFDGVLVNVYYRKGGHTPGDILISLPQKNAMFTGDVVYVDRILGLITVSNTKNWLESFAVIDDLKPQLIVPGHGAVTDLNKAQLQTRDLLKTLRAHTKKEVDGAGDMNTAIKNFDAKPFAHLKHASVWIPQLVNFTYLEIERE